MLSCSFQDQKDLLSKTSSAWEVSGPRLACYSGADVRGRDIRSGAEEKDHTIQGDILANWIWIGDALHMAHRRWSLLHKGMREPHFGAVYCAIASSLEDG